MTTKIVRRIKFKGAGTVKKARESKILGTQKRYGMQPITNFTKPKPPVNQQFNKPKKAVNDLGLMNNTVGSKESSFPSRKDSYKGGV